MGGGSEVAAPIVRFEGAPSGGFTATVCPPPDVSGPLSNEMFGRTPYERPRFARSARSFIILTNGAHSSESFVTWPTNFGEFDPDGANLQSSCAARKPRPFIISGSDRRKPEVNRSSWKRKRQPSSFASSSHPRGCSSTAHDPPRCRRRGAVRRSAHLSPVRSVAHARRHQSKKQPKRSVLHQCRLWSQWPAGHPDA